MGPMDSESATQIQGGACETFHINEAVESVQVFLSTEGRNLNARIELLQGPDCVRQLIELDEDDGYDRPLSCTLETPGHGCVVRIVNTAPMEFPLMASVEPNSFKRRGPDGGYMDSMEPMGMGMGMG